MPDGLRQSLKKIVWFSKLLLILLGVSSFQHVSPPDPTDWNAKYEKATQLVNQGQCEEAIPLLKEFIGSKPPEERDTTLRKAYFKLENCLCEVEGTEGAVVYLEKQIGKKDLSPYIRVWLLSWLAADYDGIDRKNKSIECYETGLPLAEKEVNKPRKEEKERWKDAELLRNYYMSLGRAYWNQGNHAKALPFLLRGLQYAEQANKPEKIPIALSYVADCYKSMYDPKAFDYFRRSVTLQQDYVQGYIQFSKAYMQFQMPDSALWILQQAHSLPKDLQDETDFYYQYANVYLLKGQIPEALKQIRKALRANGYPEDDTEYNRIIHLAGKIHLAAHDLNTALFWFDKVLRKNKKAGSEQEMPSADFFVLGSLEGKGKALFQQYKQTGSPAALQDAIQVFEKGLQYAEKMRLSYSNESSKLELYEYLQPVVEGGVQAWLSMGQATGAPDYVEKAFLFAERAKAAVMAEALYNQQIQHISGIPDSILEQENQLQQHIVEAETAVYESPETDSLQTELSTLKLDREQLKSDIQKRFPRYFSLKYAFSKQISLSQIRERLDEQTMLVQYLAGDTTLYAFAITQSSIRAYTLPLGERTQNTLLRFYHSISNWAFAQDSSAVAEQNFLETAPQLYQLLLSQALDGTSARRLIIVPDGMTGLIPFEALLTEPYQGSWVDVGMPYVLKKYAVSYTWSASALLSVGKDSTAASYNFAGFATDYQEGVKDVTPMVAMRDLGPLPYAPDEIDAIGRMLSGKTWVNTNATKQNFLAAAPKAGILHVALHGVLDLKNPMMSHLVFHPGEKGVENRLFASELYNLPLSARMAVLSACNSGKGPIRNGEGVMSLARALAYAGCPTLVSSLWSVNDLSTSQIMNNFYQSLKSRQPVDLALQEAKLAYLKSTTSEFSKPIYWAPFIAIGDTGALQDSLLETSCWGWWAFSGFLLILLLIYLFFQYRIRNTPT